MKLMIKNARTVSGDGKTIMEDTAITISDGVITDVIENPNSSPVGDADRTIDASGMMVVPGIINHHAHGVTFGPHLCGLRPLLREHVLENLNRHLLQGETTILNQDGLVTQEEIEETAKSHPINLKTCTARLPNLIKAAEIAGLGAGIKDRHKDIKDEEMVRWGAVAIGEVEEMTILATWVWLPEAIRRKTGKWISPYQARLLRASVLDRYVNPLPWDREKVQNTLKQIELSDFLTPEEVQKLMDPFIISLRESIKGFAEAGELAERLNIPIELHNSPMTKQAVLEIAKKHGRKINVIAAHSNSGSFDQPGEAVAHAKQLKSLGAIIDIDSDLGKGHTTLNDNQRALLKEGLVDLISTDYEGGHHDSILYFMEKAVEEGVIDLPKAISLATSNVCMAFPKLAPNRGYIKPGKVADITITDEKRISKIEYVIINGKVVVEDGCDPKEWLPIRSPAYREPGTRYVVRDIYTKLTQ
jgi:predicted amidohydrolase